jgi:hypothetical protein
LVNYRTWARLNFRGKQEWGDIFRDGKVPIQSIVTQQAKLGGNKDPESVFTIDWKELTTRQQEGILDKLSQQSGVNKEIILKEILKSGLPLRRNLIFSCGTNQVELYL